MINEIELLNHGSGFIVIGFEKGEVSDRASFNKDKGRPFLGITEKDKNRILKRVDDLGTNEVEEIIEVPTLTERILRRLRGDQ